jgi:hypothetical protein
VVSDYVRSCGRIARRGSGADQRRQLGVLEDVNLLASQPAGHEFTKAFAPDYAVNVAGLRPGPIIVE